MQKPYEGEEPYIFVSYSHEDTGEVLGIIERLMEEGYRVWYDEGIASGENWQRYIIRRVKACTVFMSMITKHFNASENCLDELGTATRTNKKLMTVFLESVEPPEEAEMRIMRMQNLRKYQYDEEEWFYNKLFGSSVLGMCMEKGNSMEETEEDVPLTYEQIKEMEDKFWEGKDLLAEKAKYERWLKDVRELLEDYPIWMYDEQESYILKNLREIQERLNVGQDERALKGQCKWHSEMARKSMDAGDLLAARKEYEECLNIARKLAEQDPENRAYQNQLYYILCRMGELLKSQGDLTAAKQLYEENLTIYKKRVEQSPEDASFYRSQIIGFLSAIRDILKSQGDLTGAKQLYEEELAMYQELAEKDPRDRRYQLNVARISHQIADILKSQGDLIGAKQLYEESLTIHKKLAEPCPEDKFYQRKIADDLDRIAEIEQILRDKQESSQCQSEENVPKGTMMSLAEFFAPAEEIEEEPAQVLPAGDSSEDTIGSSYKVFGAVSRKHELMKVLSLYMDEMEHFLGSCFYFFDSERYRNDMDYQKKADRRLKWAIKRYAKEAADKHVYLLNVAENRTSSFLLTDSHLYTKYGGHFKLSEIKIGFERERDFKPFNWYKIYFTKGKDRFPLWTGFDDEAITCYNMLNKFIETAKAYQ